MIYSFIHLWLAFVKQRSRKGQFMSTTGTFMTDTAKVGWAAATGLVRD